MITTTAQLIEDERIRTSPTFRIINRIQQMSMAELTVFVHKRVEYNGMIELSGAAAIIVRICIVQPRAGGEAEMGHQPTAEQVFGTEEPTVATAINDRNWVTISDRHYFVAPEITTGGRIGMEINYEHRLSNNMSIQSPTVGGMGRVTDGPMFLCTLADLDTPEEHATLHNVFTRTIGLADLVANQI